MKRLILVGNPNVGKSAVFWRLTGIHATTSNYPGTTVSYKAGTGRLCDRSFEVIDTPGAYSLSPTNDAERVTADLVETGDVLINVVDATNLERNLQLTLELLDRGLPVVVALNMYDDARHKGIRIDVEGLAKRLHAPVVPTIAISGFGIAELARAVCSLAAQVESNEFERRPRSRSPEERWAEIGRIVHEVQSLEHRHHTLLEWLQDISLHPRLGFLFAAVVLYASFRLIRFIGEGLIGHVFDPFFENVWLPGLMRISEMVRGSPLVHHLLVGRLIDGEVDFVQSMGLLSTGVYVPIAMVLPYVISFYFVLSLMEDIGYLPRLGVLMDGLMHKVGLHGFAVIPVLLGLGCNVPGILATRTLESKTQRFIACTLICVGVPCVSLQAMILKIVGDFGLRFVLCVYAFMFLTVVALGMILRFTARGALPELIIEIPPYRHPSLRLTLLKLYYRCRGFIVEAVPLVLVGILIVSLFDYIGLFEWVGRFTAPVVCRLWNLPREAVVPIIMGLLRKDVAASLLIPLNLTAAQTMTACVLLSLTFPCIATFIIVFTELGWRDGMKTLGVMLLTAIIGGGIAAAVFRWAAEVL